MTSSGQLLLRLLSPMVSKKLMQCLLGLSSVHTAIVHTAIVYSYIAHVLLVHWSHWLRFIKCHHF